MVFGLQYLSINFKFNKLIKTSPILDLVKQNNIKAFDVKISIVFFLSCFGFNLVELNILGDRSKIKVLKKKQLKNYKSLT